MVIAFFATTEIATFAILEIVAIELFGNSERLDSSGGQVTSSRPVLLGGRSKMVSHQPAGNPEELFLTVRKSRTVEKSEIYEDDIPESFSTRGASEERRKSRK